MSEFPIPALERLLPLQTAVAPRVWRAFLPWYFIHEPLRMVRAFLTYLRTFTEVFSFFFLIKTLFQPWKSITDPYPTKGFDIGAIMQTFFLNCTSRGVGFVFRTVALLVSLFVTVVFVCVSVAFFVAWVTFPILAVLGIAYLFTALG